MNKERFKTLVLVSLVFVSFYLTQQVWAKLPYNLIPMSSNEPIEQNDNNDLLKVVSPEQYLITFGRSHTILYSELYCDEKYDLWNNVKTILKTCFQDKDIKVDSIENEETIKNESIRAIEAQFTEKVPLYIFLKMLEVDEANDIFNKINEIDRIYIPLNGGNFIVLSNGVDYLKVTSRNFDMSNISKEVVKIERNGYTKYYSLKDYLNVESNAYMALDKSVKAWRSVYYVKNEINVKNEAQIEQIAKEFFGKDLDYVRKIEEDNGSVIYVYNNEQVLKIFNDGIISYFNSLEHTVVERNLYISLKTAVDFISSHIGWPDDVYLSSIDQITSDGSKGYRIVFNYRIGGNPVILDNGKIEHPIVVEVFNDQIKTYKRFVRKIDMSKLIGTNIKPILSPLDIIGKSDNYNLIKENYKRQTGIKNEEINKSDLREKILSSINDIYMAYYDTCRQDYGQRLKSVWTININGTTYIFDAYSGECIKVIGGIKN
ncbi:two-component system activity regulator YycH [Caldisalinibacter kiritimatiensis]|uniref:Regulatory protein YycH domain-containing protein n=1 Tax=Caldisalinibacter kiritimatiensis TaxID=1304284 RepID=R1CN98_9FIRM|nr:two-component system activity regulator YycH [Caldisalinibacter kiritimatiensis]EOD00186.1 hypothetical protein L21TH_1762 [Caldisalinibacter kiritimatiensis]